MNTAPENIIALVLSIFLLVSTFVLIRPANGERNLLVGFFLSALFGMYIAVIRVFSLQSTTRSTLGFVLCFWLFAKLWTLYATALNTRRPFVTLIRNGLHILFGRNVDK